MQTLQGCGDTKSVHTRLRTFAGHGLGPRKLSRRCLRACVRAATTTKKGGREALSPMSSESESGREELRESTKWNWDNFPQIKRSVRFHSDAEVGYDVRRVRVARGLKSFGFFLMNWTSGPSRLASAFRTPFRIIHVCWSGCAVTKLGHLGTGTSTGTVPLYTGTRTFSREASCVFKSVRIFIFIF
jgi:hypothetical protein